jgi:hypothetical protein
VPTPLVKIDDQNRFHSEVTPAIGWKGGREIFYLQGQDFEKPIWDKLVSRKFDIKDLMKLEDADQRAVAIRLVKPEALLEQLKAKHINTGKKGTRLYEVSNFAEKVGKLLSEDYEATDSDTEYCMVMDDPFTDRVFLEWVEPSLGKLADADLCQAKAFSITKKQYLEMELEG